MTKYLKPLLKLLSEIIAIILLPFFLTWAAAVCVYLFIILPVSGVFYLAGLKNWEVIADLYLYSNYSYLLWFVIGCYVFYEMAIRSGEFVSLFIKYRNSIRNL